MLARVIVTVALTTVVPVYPPYVTTRLYTVVAVTPPSTAVHVWLGVPSLFVPGAHERIELGSVTAVPFCSSVRVTNAEISCVPEEVVPLMVNSWVVPLSGNETVVGVIVMEDTVSATVAVVVPVTAPEAAVMVAVPAETPVKTPPVLMVATEVSELDQHATLPVQLVPPLRLPVLPSLYVATAVI